MSSPELLASQDFFPSEEIQGLTLEDAIALGAEDSLFFGEYFFPKTCSQKSPPAHKEMAEALAGPSSFVSFMIYRGSGKTTRARLHTAWLISYGLTRTTLMVGKSEEAAARNLEWVMRQVEQNSLWVQAFGLKKGSKWNSTECEIVNETLGVTVRLIALGIMGSVRGINVDDARPDTILVDDPCDEENTATSEQRTKTNNVFFGSLQNSLAPLSEAPMRKMILLQTVLNEEDLVSLTQRDGQWECHTIPVFAPDGQSAWPERWTTKELLEMKQGFIDRGMANLWLREMECRVVSDTNATFSSTKVKFWDIIPEGGRTILAIDPTPPPKDGPPSNASKLDKAVIKGLRSFGPKVYCIASYETVSPDPFELVNQIFQMALDLGATEIVIETVLFARVLASILEREMLSRRTWFILHKVEDKRKKSVRIGQEVGSALSAGVLYLDRKDQALLDQLLNYPMVNHDDHLDALSIGLGLFNKARVYDSYEEAEVLEGEFEALPDTWMSAP